MIYEIRTYDIRPGTLKEVENRFAEAYEHRKNYSEMAAFWHAEIGPINQVVHVWPYKDTEERSRIRAAAVKEGNWPPKIGEFCVAQRSEIVAPAPFSPELKPGRVGPFFEFRTYTLPPGDTPVAIENWGKAMPRRNLISPVVAVWYSDVGALNKWMHIWAYPSLDRRMEVRDLAIASGEWPPSTLAKKEGRKSYSVVAQENKIMLPAAFSPLQ